MMSGLLVSSLPGTAAPGVLTPQRDPVSEKAARRARRRAVATFAQADTLTWMAEIYDNSRREAAEAD